MFGFVSQFIELSQKVFEPEMLEQGLRIVGRQDPIFWKMSFAFTKNSVTKLSIRTKVTINPFDRHSLTI